MHYKYKSSSCILYLSSIRHTCSVHVLYLMRIYRIIVQIHISPQSKIGEVHQNKKASIYVLVKIY